MHICLWVNHILGVRGTTSIASFRCFETCLREMFADYSGSDVFVDALLSWGSASISIPTQLRNRKEGESNYTLGKLISHAMNLITSFSIAFCLPVRIILLLFGDFTAARSWHSFSLPRARSPRFYSSDYVLSNVFRDSAVDSWHFRRIYRADLHAPDASSSICSGIFRIRGERCFR